LRLIYRAKGLENDEAKRVASQIMRDKEAMPFLWTSGRAAVIQCIALSIVALAATGIFTSLFNGRSAGFSAIRQIVIGLAAAALTDGAGHLLGVSVS